MSHQRRKFLKDSVSTLLSLGISPQVISVLMQATLNRAYGNILDSAAIKNGIRYAHLSFPGAPPRWLFDLPLKPNGNDSFTASNGFGTALEISATGVKPVYRTFKHPSKSIHVPYVWGLNLSAGANFSAQNFSSILNHVAFIRGMDMEINNHGISNGRQVAPIIGGYSLHGSISDLLQNPIPNVISGGSTSALVYKSRKGLASLPAQTAANTATDNPFTRLLLPFKPPANSAAREDALSSAISQAHDQFDAYSSSMGQNKSGLRTAHDNADQMIRDQVYTLASEGSLGWINLRDKYQAIFNAAHFPAKGSLPGIFDKAITGIDKNPMFQSATSPNYYLNSDIRDSLPANSNAPSFVANFALLEFLFRTGLSGTVNLAFAPIPRVIINNNGGTDNFIFDQHRIGVVPATIITTLFYRAFLSCLTECISKFKADGIFDKTIIHIGSEFNRSPQTAGGGSDHGFMASGTSIISGMIKDTQVLGNIKASPTDATRYAGTWGESAPWHLPDNRAIRVTDVARTITSMSGARDIVNNGYSLLVPDSNGGWVSHTPQGAKNV